MRSFVLCVSHSDIKLIHIIENSFKNYLLDLRLFSFSLRFSAFRSFLQLLKILVETISQHNFSFLDSIVAIIHHLLSPFQSFDFPFLPFIFSLPLFPLLVGNFGHDFHIRFCLFFPFFHFLLFMVLNSFLNHLFSLLDKGLFEPLFEYFVSTLLLYLFLKLLSLFFLFFLEFLLLFLLLLVLLPLQHCHFLFFFLLHFFFSFLFHCFQNVFLCFSN